MNEISDVIVVGGGAAGLSAALMLSRARRRVIVVDAGAPRNRFAPHAHGILGHDGKSPLELLAAGRGEVEGYGGSVVAGTARAVSRMEDGFSLELDDGSAHRARRLIVATGLRDELPEIDGLAAQWGTGVVTCPYCDGWEARDTRIGVLATSAAGIHHAQLLRQWSAHIVYLPHRTESPSGDDRRALEARGIRVEEGLVARITAEGGRLTGVEVLDEHGERRMIPLDSIFTAPRAVPLDGLLQQLGAARTETPHGPFVETDATGRTSVDGVWAVGNVQAAPVNVPLAMSMGAFAGAAVNADLITSEIAEALDRDRGALVSQP